MYWWVIFWIIVVAAVGNPIVTLAKMSAEKKISSADKIISFIISQAISLWINISILIFMWGYLVK